MPPPGGDLVKIAGWAAYTPHPSHPGPGPVVHPGSVHTMKFHEAGVSPVGGGVMAGYHHHNLMDMYPGPAINTMDWKNTSQVGQNFQLSYIYFSLIIGLGYSWCKAKAAYFSVF